MPALEKWRFTTAEVATVAMVPQATLSAWLARKMLLVDPGPGTGKSREFTFEQLVHIRIVADLVRVGVAVGKASMIAKDVRYEPGERQGRYLVVVPSMSEQQPLITELVQTELLGDGLDRCLSFIAKKHSMPAHPASVLIIDLTELIAGIIELLRDRVKALKTELRNRSDPTHKRRNVSYMLSLGDLADAPPKKRPPRSPRKTIKRVRKST